VTRPGRWSKCPQRSSFSNRSATLYVSCLYLRALDGLSTHTMGAVGTMVQCFFAWRIWIFGRVGGPKLRNFTRITSAFIVVVSDDLSYESRVLPPYQLGELPRHRLLYRIPHLGMLKFSPPRHLILLTEVKFFKVDSQPALWSTTRPVVIVSFFRAMSSRVILINM
jgi:hypothetical protein